MTVQVAERACDKASAVDLILSWLAVHCREKSRDRASADDLA
jgi:hypothetical protein